MVFGQAEARERRAGGIPLKAFAKYPGRENPGSHPKATVLTPCAAFRDSCRGKTQEPRLARPARSVSTGSNGKANGKWGLPDGNIPDTRPEHGSDRKIPGALPVRNKTGQGSKGANRQEGNQTLETDRSGHRRRP